jgi:uncharacterized membrane protein YfcA
VALAAIPFGLAIGLSVGALGAGGSVLAVPVLVYVLDEPVPTATTVSLVVVLAAALAGGAEHARTGRVCWNHALALVAAGVPTLAAGTAAAEAVDDAVLVAAFAPLMVVAAVATWRSAERRDPRAAALGRECDCPPLRAGHALAAGLGVGFLTGFFGVGGGFLVVPALVVGLGFAMRAAAATSLAVVAAMSLLGLVAHLAAGRELDPGVTVAMGLACAVGAVAGASVAGRVPQPALGRAFALLLGAVAAWVLVSALALGGPSA